MMDKDILTEASLRAAHFLGLDTAQIAQISRETQLDSQQVAILLVRTYKLLYQIMGGHEAEMRLWMTSENSHLKGIPSELIMSAGGLNEVACYLERFK
jgi:hypothetical protein|tara:strand:+ start:553 stop:846 length:294 start_codon:yes stop_codon:yes gene_type:complete